MLQLQMFMFQVDQADMYPWQIIQKWLILQPTIIVGCRISKIILHQLLV